MNTAYTANYSSGSPGLVKPFYPQKRPGPRTLRAPPEASHPCEGVRCVLSLGQGSVFAEGVSMMLGLIELKFKMVISITSRSDDIPSFGDLPFIGRLQTCRASLDCLFLERARNDEHSA